MTTPRAHGRRSATGRRAPIGAAAFITLLVLATAAAAQEPAEETTASEPEIAEEAGPVERIRAALDAIGGYERVTVELEAEVVKLRGEVRTPSARTAAERVAERAAPDALYVANGIEVVAPEDGDEGQPTLTADDRDQEIAGSLRRIFREVRELRAVEVTVEGGIVHLSGTTTDENALERSAAIARDQEGVLYVDQGVTVRATVWEQLTTTLTDLRARAKGWVARLPVVGIGLLIILLASLLAKVLFGSHVGTRLLKNSPLLQQVVARILGTVLLLSGIILALDVMGASGAVGAVLGTAGIVGLAVGFAFKDIVENYLAGILLAFHRPFAAGDLVEVEGVQGKVVRLASRETMLMTLEGNHVQIPNSQVFKASMTNFTRNPRRRFDFAVGIGTGEELARALKVGLEALRKIEGVMEDPQPFARVEGFGDSSMTVQYFAWVDQREFDWWKVRSEGVRMVKRALDAAGVDVPNPIYDVDVYTEQGKRATHLEAPNEPETPPEDLRVDDDLDKQIADDPESQKRDLLDEA
jgi:small conductance mechanosensitive channel